MTGKQPDLFDQQPYGGTPPHQRPSETSLLAAVDVKKRAGALRRRVYERIQARGANGATADEIADWLDLPSQTASPRVRELYLLGLIRKAGLRRYTRNGRLAEVWIASHPGAPAR